MSSVMAQATKTKLKSVLILGRPNVGKSTLFNQLARSRDAIVAGVPGVTVDLRFETVQDLGKAFRLIDSGGFDATQTDELSRGRNEKVLEALVEADVVLFVFDVRVGILAADKEVFGLIRRHAKLECRVLVIANKSDDANKEYDGALEAYDFGCESIAVSSEHRLGIETLREQLFNDLGIIYTAEVADEDRPIRFALIGRPNVGKSTWCNLLVGSQRSVVSPVAGTTRDTLVYPFEMNGKKYEILDTAGLRKPGRREGVVERVSGVKALRALEDVDVAVLILDAAEGLTELDVRIAKEAWSRGSGIIGFINKWDLTKEKDVRAWCHRSGYKFSFLDTLLPMLPGSGKTGFGKEKLLQHVARIARRRYRKLEVAELNEALRQWTQEAPHRRTKSGQTVRLSYLIQTAPAPQRLLLFSNRPKDVAKSYLRFLENRLRSSFDLGPNPIYFAVVNSRKSQ